MTSARRVKDHANAVECSLTDARSYPTPRHVAHAIALPHPRNPAVTNPRGVFLVAGQLGPQGAFFE